MIELAAVRDPDDVVDAFAAVFGVKARAGQTVMESLADFLRTKQLLLVVDNCEHVLDAVADVVEEIGHTCPRVVVLATSREGLALDGERMLAVPALAAPAADADLAAVGASEAVQLFVERARAADADFALGAANGPAVGQVCRRLDGVPLAIELAAARVTSMSPAELASALDRRFDLLAGGRRRAVKRQQTLRATIDWSYDLLDEPQQRLLARLAVFAGGCTREAAEAIAAGGPIEGRKVLGLLTDLVDRSLVVAERGGVDTRYRLLETIREYGEERLVEHGETDALRDRHARYYAEYAFRCNDGQWGPEQVAWGARMTADVENLLAAFAHAVDTHDLDLASQPAGIDQPDLRPDRPGADPARRAGPRRAGGGTPPRLPARAHGRRVRRAGPRGGESRPGIQRRRARRGTGVALPQPVHPRPQVRSACTSRRCSRCRRARGTTPRPAFLEAAEALRTASRMGHVPNNLSGAASALCYAERFAEAVPVATEGLVVARAAGMPMLINECLVALAQALSREDPERARALLRRSSPPRRRLRDLQRAHPDDPRRGHDP